MLNSDLIKTVYGYSRFFTLALSQTKFTISAQMAKCSIRITDVHTHTTEDSVALVWKIQTFCQSRCLMWRSACRDKEQSEFWWILWWILTLCEWIWHKGTSRQTTWFIIVISCQMELLGHTKYGQRSCLHIVYMYLQMTEWRIVMVIYATMLTFI